MEVITVYLLKYDTSDDLFLSNNVYLAVLAIFEGMIARKF